MIERQRGLPREPPCYPGRTRAGKMTRSRRGPNARPAHGGGLLPEVLINQFLEIAQRTDGAIVVEGKQLHHLDAADVLYRINPELGVVDARPTHAAGAAEACVLRVV